MISGAKVRQPSSQLPAQGVQTATSTMSFSGFVKLPPELVMQILSSLDTPRDLFALITTSQFFYQVFQGGQTAILADVIRKAMPDDNVYTAVAACKAARISKLGWANSPVAAVTEAQAEFLENNPRGRVHGNTSLHDRNLLLSLYKLWWTLEYFLDRFQQDALKIAASKLPLSQEPENQNITSNERSRLQRAFLRFEIYRRFTPLHIQSGSFTNAAHAQTQAFLECFSPWEREEILSVHEFLVELAKDIVRNCEDYMVHEIASVARDMAATLGALQQRYESMSTKKLQMMLELRGLDISMHDDPAVGRRFQFFVGRGLPFIKWLSNLPPNHKIDTVARLSLERCEPTLFDVLVSKNREITSHDDKMDWSVKQHMGRLRHPNQGWLWAEAYDFTTGTKPLLERYALRRMGYVFWDAARLHNDWKLQDTLPPMLELVPRSDCDNDRDWLEEPCFEERFKDIIVPEGTFIQREDKSDAYSRLLPSEEWEEQLDDTIVMPTPFSDQEVKLFSIEY
nr:hypothetical protein CFP56_02893 [Quercus suber]